MKEWGREVAQVRQRRPGVESACIGGRDPQRTLCLLPSKGLLLKTSRGDFCCCWHKSHFLGFLWGLNEIRHVRHSVQPPAGNCMVAFPPWPSGNFNRTTDSYCWVQAAGFFSILHPSIMPSLPCILQILFQEKQKGECSHKFFPWLNSIQKEAQNDECLKFCCSSLTSSITVGFGLFFPQFLTNGYIFFPPVKFYIELQYMN